jgi:hypothetical protein
MRATSRTILIGVLMTALGAAATARGQLPEPGSTASAAPNPLSDPTMKPGKVLLYDLEARFAKDVLDHGGAAFAQWFADDAVELGNGAAPAIGKVAIVKSATWSPRPTP